jgi:2-methylisocitrate lyase-like PEP mutase family enzyme
MKDLEANRKRFKAMHAESTGFVMPNVWDAGSAVILAQAGFRAIATTSAGIAFSFGKPDYHMEDASLSVSRADMFARARQIATAVAVPVNGDLEAGYGDQPADVARTIELAIDAGLAGGNIEDRIPTKPALYEEAFAVERIRAARAAIDTCGSSFVLTARTDVFLMGAKDAVRASIRRANLFREAGADCLYPPGVDDPETIQLLAREIAGPLNVVLGLKSPNANARALLDAGARRVSLGGSIARAALGFVRAAAAELFEKGSIGFAADQIPQSELNALFAKAGPVSIG